MNEVVKKVPKSTLFSKNFIRLIKSNNHKSTVLDTDTIKTNKRVQNIYIKLGY